MKKNGYFLIDVNKNKKNIYKFKICALASEISLFHGTNFTDELVDNYWNDADYPPASGQIKVKISSNNMKWYINNFIEIQDKVWNADFIRGMTQCGKVKYHPKRFPKFVWHNNKSVEEIIESSPFYGKKCFNFSKARNKKIKFEWYSVPALALKYSESTISFMAGVLATGNITKKNNLTYAKYNKKMEPLLKKWNIPIEYKNKIHVFISPFWIMLLTPWMPEPCQKWLKVKKVCNGEKYALILWKIFTGKDIKAKGIPCLICRRKYYYKYKTIKGLERKWVDEKLVELDIRFKDIIHYWAKNNN